MRRYDLVKEFVIALVVVGILAAGLAMVFSSPDEKPITIAEWAKAAPNDVVATAVTELDGTSGTASYGPPYNHTAGAGQKLGPFPLERWAGVRTPVNAAQDFVIGPLRGAPQDRALTTALTTYSAAPADQRVAWASGYDAALQKADGDPAKVPTGSYGPVPLLTNRLLGLARSGALDGVLLAEGGFYQTDYTRPLMFLSDGTYLSDRAASEHLSGDQWGMMNETGNYPGQAWLWLYTFWYQVQPFKSSPNADALIWAVMGLLTLVLILVPFIPGLRSIPRLIPVYRLIWRDHYRRERR